MEDAAFARDPLQAAMPRLQERLEKLRAAEEDARRWAAYEKAKAERDKLAEELARVYPPIVDQLVDLATRLAANDKALEACNRHARPAGAGVRSHGGGSRPRPVRLREAAIRTERRDLSLTASASDH